MMSETYSMNEVVLFKTDDVSLSVQVAPECDTVWLSSNQMAELFGRDEKTIRKHVNKVFDDDELEYANNTQKMRVDGVKQPVVFLLIK